MALRDLIKEQVANAFIQLGDIKQSITFNVTTARDYDFISGDVSESIDPVTLSGVIEEVSAEENSDSEGILCGITAKFIVNKEDLPNYQLFDSFTTGGTAYKIVEYTDNGYSVEGVGISE